MRTTCVLGFALLCLNGPAVAQQGPCTEGRVKAGAAQPNPPMSSDLYFFSRALEKPVVGKQALDQASAPVSAARKNEKTRRTDLIESLPRRPLTWRTNMALVKCHSTMPKSESTMISRLPISAYGRRKAGAAR